MNFRKITFACLASTAALAFAAPAAGASTFPAWIPSWLNGSAAAGFTVPTAGSMPTVGNGPFAAGACGSTSNATTGSGATAGATAQTCLGAGLSFVGPAIGQVATVIGPTIIAGSVVGSPIVVSAGNGAAGP